VRAFVAVLWVDAAVVVLFDVVVAVETVVDVAAGAVVVAACVVDVEGVVAAVVDACDSEAATGWITAETSSVVGLVVNVDAAAELALVPRARPMRGRKLRTLAERMPARIAWYRFLLLVAIGVSRPSSLASLVSGRNSSLDFGGDGIVRSARCLHLPPKGQEKHANGAAYARLSSDDVLPREDATCDRAT
jgi:hypothetical protein